MDELGDRMKSYEARETERWFLPTLPVYARIDGRNFSSFTRSMKRPFDSRMTNAMVETTKNLVEATHACIGYTQSDEISLVWLGKHYDSGIFFNGKIMKMTSILAALATAHFTRAIRHSGFGPEYENKLPHFDCRVLQLPDRTEAANMILWRELDATKNAISMAARSVYSHRELEYKNGAEMQELLFIKGINFNDYPISFKRGTFVRRESVEALATAEILANIPETHRPQPGAVVTRTITNVFTLPKFSTVVNREAVIFDGAAARTVEPQDKK